MEIQFVSSFAVVAPDPAEVGKSCRPASSSRSPTRLASTAQRRNWRPKTMSCSIPPAPDSGAGGIARVLLIEGVTVDVS
jgi:hypothetical protein